MKPRGILKNGRNRDYLRQAELRRYNTRSTALKEDLQRLTSFTEKNESSRARRPRFQSAGSTTSGASDSESSVEIIVVSKKRVKEKITKAENILPEPNSSESKRELSSISSYKDSDFKGGLINREFSDNNDDEQQSVRRDVEDAGEEDISIDISGDCFDFDDEFLIAVFDNRFLSSLELEFLNNTTTSEDKLTKGTISEEYNTVKIEAMEGASPVSTATSTAVESLTDYQRQSLSEGDEETDYFTKLRQRFKDDFDNDSNSSGVGEPLCNTNDNMNKVPLPCSGEEQTIDERHEKYSSMSSDELDIIQSPTSRADELRKDLFDTKKNLSFSQTSSNNKKRSLRKKFFASLSRKDKQKS